MSQNNGSETKTIETKEDQQKPSSSSQMDIASIRLLSDTLKVRQANNNHKFISMTYLMWANKGESPNQTKQIVKPFE